MDCIRPYGIEPKIKFYYSIKCADRDTVEQKLREIQSIIISHLEL